MTPRRPTLARRLALLISAVLAAAWVVAIAAMALILHHEQDELYDQILITSAEALLPTLASDAARASAQMSSAHDDPNEALVWRLIDRQGRVLAASPMSEAAQFPDTPRPGKVKRTLTHTVYTTKYTAQDMALQLADPLAERREAWRESFLAFLLPMLALLPLGWLAGGWVTRLALRPVEDLRAEMAQRDGLRLEPMDADAHPAELAQIVTTLNGFMARVSQALDGERAFATNAAHELRTPVAVALAQVQRLAQETGDPAASARIASVETALRRMARLVARLLQLARAESGIGLGEERVDAAALLPHVLREIGRDADRLALSVTQGPVWTVMDADALAIVAGNLIENALQHSPPDSRVEVSLNDQGLLSVSNPGPVLPAAQLAQMGKRFSHRKGGGFGLGLHIVSQIARQAGTALELASPVPDRDGGFQARIQLPPAQP
ncbi:ATP-binding protein [Paracoccus sp. PAR01]|uniref:sensor histidine kinase n=1 Tax=Paracoccus sp. PAR01 TaxID=2769282 RepID=UPI001783B64B|nr:hypothetical protein [Paracoccus sp. PAR01]